MQATQLKKESKPTFEERVLLSFARDPREPEIGATASYTVDNCLDYARRTIAGFEEIVRNKVILDYGCGPGFQAVAMRVNVGAQRVFGVDIDPIWIQAGRDRAREFQCLDAVQFGHTVPSDLEGKFDAVLSLSAFEHYADPVAELASMRRQLKPGGIAMVSWAEPWYSHSGSHVNNFTKMPLTNYPMPWLNLFFSDKALLTLRSRFRPDRPERLEDIVGGLNRMTVARFERIIQSSDMKILRFDMFSTKNIPFVTRIPVLRELLTSSVCAILQKPE